MRKYVVILSAAVLALSAYLLNTEPQRIMGSLPPLELAQAAETALLTGDTMPGGAAGSDLFIMFSHSPGFYTEGIEVEIYCFEPEAVVYYTTDGSLPTTQSEIYETPLKFEAFGTPDGKTAVVLKAVAVFNGKETQVLSGSYFINSDINERFTTLVFSLSTNDEYLYDYDNGIFIEGRLRDEYKAENPRAQIDPPAPANFNIRGREGERPVYVEVFTQDGTRVLSQAAGLRVHGGWSRANDQKSIKLIARNSYEDKAGKFRYDFFPSDVAADIYGSPITQYDTIVLRNGANDRDFGMLRNEVASELARQAGFRLVSPYAPCAVFLNGEYYGFAWIQAAINEQYLQDVYGAPTKEFEIVGDGEEWYNTDNIEAKNSLIKMNSYANEDLTDDAVYAELCELLDIENFLLYYAFETYMDNNDWPHNNMKRWRYAGPLPSGPSYPPELDGRWRYIMYDLDWTLGLYTFPHTVDSIRRVTSGSPLLSALLKRDDTKALFAQYLSALASTVITEENVAAVINELYAMAEPEITRALNSRKYARWVTKDTIAENHEFMINYAKGRPNVVRGHIKSRLGYSDEFDIVITGGEANFGAGTGARATFLSGGDILIKPVIPKFHVFEQWVLNGRKVLYEEEIYISGFMAQNGEVTLELITKEALPPLMLENAYSNSGGNGVSVYNPNDKAVQTGTFYISDNPDIPGLWLIPGATIEAGERLHFAGRGSANPNDIHKVQLPFNVGRNEVIILSDENGNILDSILVNE